jgi:hypothetical protein
MPMRRIHGISAALILGIALTPGLTAQQKMDSINADRAMQILRDAHDCVKKNYYDQSIHGLDWEARYREYQEKMKNARSLSQAFSLVAGFLDGLKDTHTAFIPPSRPVRMDYGYRMQIYGDNAFITRVRPGTDAVEKVHPGDEVINYNKTP